MAKVTPKEVWALFKETDRLIKEYAQKAEIRFQEAEKRSQETDRKFQETDRQFQETDRKFQETDRKFQESRRRFQETERLLKQQSQELNRQIGQLGGRLGDFVEGMVKPAVVRLFQERGIDVRMVSRDVEVNNPKLGLAMQIDLLALDSDSCVLVEVKSKLSIDDVDEHLERMEKFKRLFPDYVAKKVYGAVAGMVIDGNVAKYAYRKGFFVIAQRGDSAVLLNDQKFKPAIW